MLNAQAGATPEILTSSADELAEDSHWEKLGFGSFAPYASAFTRLYGGAAERIHAAQQTRAPAASALLAPGLQDGLAVMAFIDAALRSSKAGAGWVTL